MRLDISEILREVGSNVPYEITLEPLVEEYIECVKPLEGQIVFMNTGGTLLLRGQVTTSLALPCSRCDTYFENPMTLQVEEQFELQRTSVGPRTQQIVTVIEEDESPIAGKLFDGQVFDLTEMLRQYLLLEEPTRPLPPDLPDGRCAQCKRRPEEVLGNVVEAPEAETLPVNPAFARLGELLNKPTEE